MRCSASHIFAKNMKEELIPDIPSCRSLCGKLMNDLTMEEYVDRLTIIVSGEGVSQLLGERKNATNYKALWKKVASALSEVSIKDENIVH